VHFSEALVLDLELDAAGGVDLNDVDELPGNASGGEAAGDGFESVAGQQALEYALDRAAQANLHLGDAQEMDRTVAEPFQIDVVDPDNFAAVDVDDLAVDEILLEEEVILIAIEWRQGRRGAQFQGA